MNHSPEKGNKNIEKKNLGHLLSCPQASRSFNSFYYRLDSYTTREMKLQQKIPNREKRKFCWDRWFNIVFWGQRYCFVTYLKDGPIVLLPSLHIYDSQFPWMKQQPPTAKLTKERKKEERRGRESWEEEEELELEKQLTLFRKKKRKRRKERKGNSLRSADYPASHVSGAGQITKVTENWTKLN